jgi:DNA-binding NtrC family response regulator
VVAPDLALRADQRMAIAAQSERAAGAGPATLEPLRLARRCAADDFERAYVRALLERTQGNVSRAAAIAEVSRQMIQKLMRKHGIGE